ncbi:MAG TPA: hypothetical protein PLW35_14400, partial [Verrucomicrobiota bacterium]|nr:hypothetical protein [Verrucomicrobiota bacterium]
WVLKNGAVDFLVDVPDGNAALVVCSGVCLVDMADLAGLGMQNLTINLELLGNRLQVLLAVQWHRTLLHFKNAASGSVSYAWTSKA